MTLKYTIDSTGTRIQLDALDRNISATGGLRTHLDGMVGEWLRGRAADRFAHGGGTEVGGKWKPLKQSTIARKRAYGVPNPSAILIRSGDLSHWLSQEADASVRTFGGGMAITWPDRDEGFPLELRLRNAQRGTGAPMNTPARPVVGVNQVDQRAVLKMIREWIIT